MTYLQYSISKQIFVSHNKEFFIGTFQGLKFKSTESVYSSLPIVSVADPDQSIKSHITRSKSNKLNLYFFVKH